MPLCGFKLYFCKRFKLITLKFNVKNFVKKKFYLLLHPMKIVPKKVFCFLAITITSVVSASGPPPPGHIPPGPDPIPIDSGLVFLFAAAISYSFYKIYQMKINKKAPM